MALSALLILALPGQAATLYVSKSGDASDGLSWPTAYTAISSAINAATAGDEIWVQYGDYGEPIFVPEGISLYGGFSGSEATTEFRLRNPRERVTRLSPSEDSDMFDERRSIIVAGNNSLIDGFTISKSTNPAYGNLGHCTIRGFYCDNVHCAIQNCIFYKNGQYNPTGEIPLEFHGGALYCRDSTLDCVGCDFIENELWSRRLSSGGAIHAEGNSDLFLDKCLFSRNDLFVYNTERECAMEAFGGGVRIGYGAHAVIENCVFDQNSLYFVGGTYCWVHAEGSAILVDGTATVRHSTVFGNRDDNSHNWIHSNDWASLLIENCIVYADPLPDWLQHPHFGLVTGNAVVHFSDIIGGYPGVGNIDADPRFRDPQIGQIDFRLRSSSPCIDSGTVTDVATDFYGYPRPVDIIGFGRDGPGAFDMGAQEFHFFNEYRGDFNGNLRVDPLDLFYFESAWRQKNEILTDPRNIRSDSEINAPDLLILMSDWRRVTGAM